MKTERVEGSVRGRNVREYLCEVVEGGMEALEEWCENIFGTCAGFVR